MVRIILILALFLLGGVPVSAGEHPLPADVKAELEALPDPGSRVAYLQNRLQRTGPDAAVLLRLGNELFDQSQFQDAINAYEGALAVDEEFVGALVNLGSVYDELGQLKEAARTYKRALALDPQDDKTLCNLGGVYFKQREHERAMNSFLAALEANASSQLAHYNLAILFADSGVYEEAAREWAAAVAIDPESDLGARSAQNIEIIRQLQAEQAQPRPSLPAHGPGDGHNH